MLAGQKPFQGETVTDALAAVVTFEPEWEKLPEATPGSIRNLLNRCLQKVPTRRLHSIADARIELEDAVGDPPQATTMERAPGPGKGTSIFRAAALAVAAAVVGGGLTAALVLSQLGRDEVVAPRGPQPVVVLMDTLAPFGVYDTETRRNAGTNADDLNDLLRDLPVELHKETLGSRWDREDQILAQRPDLIVIHRSAFYHSINLELGFGYRPYLNATIEAQADRVYEIVQEKLMALFGYVGLGDPHTRFVVYSRGWVEEQQLAFVTEIESRYPHLKDRIFTFQVPRDVDGNASFRDPATGEAIRGEIVAILGLEDWELELQ
jgi:hypothetical protein